MSNRSRGLSASLGRAQPFVPRDFSPSPSHVTPGNFIPIQFMKRQELLELTDHPNPLPVFQMLYLVMGHENWMRMYGNLMKRLETEAFSDRMVEQAAARSFPEPLSWFFDYWIRDGKGYPCYQITEATARILSDDSDSGPRYELVARVWNLGTGRMPVPISVQTSGDTATTRTWIGPGETATWRVALRYLPKFVEVDPQGWIFMAPHIGSGDTRTPALAKREVEMQTESAAGARTRQTGGAPRP
jgi:hypothetical protein